MIPAPHSSLSTRLLLGGFVLLVAGTLATGCAESPTTTYRDAHGETVTVQWRDYPADAFTDADDVLAQPTREETAEHFHQLRAAVTAAIEAELGDDYAGLKWRDAGEGGWHAYGGNGYGGDSMLQVYNSASWETEVEVAPADWQRVLDAAERELAEWGIHSANRVTASEEETDLSHWLQYTDYFDGGEFVTVSVQDARRDEQALADAEEYGHLVSGISLFYGIQTISEADRAEFERRAAPFAGLIRPESTHSD